MNTSTPTEREAFEAWRTTKTPGLDMSRNMPDGSYNNSVTDYQWTAWQAARQHESSLATPKAEGEAYDLGEQIKRGAWALDNGWQKLCDRVDCLVALATATHAAPAVPAGDRDAQRLRFMDWYKRHTGEDATLKNSRYFAFTKTAEVAFAAWLAAPPPAPLLPAGEPK